MTRWDHALYALVALWLLGTGVTLVWLAFHLAGLCP